MTKAEKGKKLLSYKGAWYKLLYPTYPSKPCTQKRTEGYTLNVERKEQQP